MKKIVVKISSNLINPDNGYDIVDKIAKEAKILKEKGHQVIIVTSGAVMYGLKKLSYTKRPDSLPLLQSCAAIGQITLMWRFQNVFEKYNLIPAEILLSADDFKVRQRYLNLRNSIETLLDIGAIPIINENDSVNTEELKLGDNDHLSSLVSIMMDCDTLAIFTDVDGYYDGDPKQDPDAKLVSRIDIIDKKTLSFAKDSCSQYTVGGMKAKLISASKAVNAGVDVFIGSGMNSNLLNIISGSERGTYITAKKGSDSARKKWLAFAPSHKSGVVIDSGALNALNNHKSLLPTGILDVEG